MTSRRAANILVVPVQDINAALRSDFDTESDPGQIVRWHEVIAVFSNEAGTTRFHYVGEDGVLMNVAHEQSIAILLRESIGEIKARPSVS